MIVLRTWCERSTKHSRSRNAHLYSETRGWGRGPRQWAAVRLNPVDQITIQRTPSIPAYTLWLTWGPQGSAVWQEPPGKRVIWLLCSHSAPLSPLSARFQQNLEFQCGKHMQGNNLMLHSSSFRCTHPSAVALVAGREKDCHPVFLQRLSHTASELTPKSRVSREKEKLLFLEGKREFWSLWENLGIIIPYSKHTKVTSSLFFGF